MTTYSGWTLILLTTAYRKAWSHVLVVRLLLTSLVVLRALWKLVTEVESPGMMIITPVAPTAPLTPGSPLMPVASEMS